MKVIGPYVVLRELAAQDKARGRAEGETQALSPRALSTRTLWATDRLTGMSALLHPVTAIAPLPTLPDHPALLPVTGRVGGVAQSYLVTELPLQALPAYSPLHTARGALQALDVLHRAGLVHGNLDPGQFWVVDGRLCLTGAGLPRPGMTLTPADDLRDLADALEAMGADAALLGVLRSDPELLSAAEVLELLQVGLSVEQVASLLEHAYRPGQDGESTLWRPQLLDTPPGDESGSPALEGRSLPVGPWMALEGSGPSLGGALADEWFQGEGEAPSSSAEEGKAAEVGEPSAAGDNQESTGGSAPSLPPAEREALPERLVVSAAPTPLETREPSQSEAPEAEASDPESPAPVALHEALPEETRTPEHPDPEPAPLELEAPRDEPPTQVSPALSPEPPLPPPVVVPAEAAPLTFGGAHGDNTPSDSADGDLAEFQRVSPGAAPERAEAPAFPASSPAPLPLAPAEPSLKGVPVPLPSFAAAPAPARPGQAARPARGSGDPKAGLLRWLLPALGLLMLSFSAALLVRSALGARGCCSVNVRLTGLPRGEQARAVILRAPRESGLRLGDVLPDLPGTLHLPSPGEYRLKVTAPGREPVRVTLRVPARRTLTVPLDGAPSTGPN